MNATSGTFNFWSSLSRPLSSRTAIGNARERRLGVTGKNSVWWRQNYPDLGKRSDWFWPNNTRSTRTVNIAGRTQATLDGEFVTIALALPIYLRNLSNLQFPWSTHQKLRDSCRVVQNVATAMVVKLLEEAWDTHFTRAMRIGWVQWEWHKLVGIYDIVD